MRRPIARLAIAVAALTLAACGADSDVCWTTDTPEQLADRPSPLDSTSVRLGESQLKVCYGRPSARERPVMGALVPFGAVWRFGANEATSIRIPFPAEIGGVAVQPGSYSLYVVPGQETWSVTVNGIVERWGIPVGPDVQAADVGSFMVPAEAENAEAWRDDTKKEPGQPEEIIDSATPVAKAWEISAASICTGSIPVSSASRAVAVL